MVRAARKRTLGGNPSEPLYEDYRSMIIRSYVSSNTRLLFNGEKTPPFLGIWLGMKAVERYMKKHPEMTLKSLLECTDYSGMIKELN